MFNGRIQSELVLVNSKEDPTTKRVNQGMDVLRRGEDILSELSGTRQNVLFFHTMHVRNLEQRRLLIGAGVTVIEHSAS